MQALITAIVIVGIAGLILLPPELALLQRLR